MAGGGAGAASPADHWAVRSELSFGGQPTDRCSDEATGEFGWLEGRTITVEYRWAQSTNSRFQEIADEFVRLKVDLIFANSTEAVLAAKRATATIPIVFPAAGDPVGNGLVASLARPGGNVTGLSNQQTDLSGKRLQLLREFIPDLRRLAALGNVDSGNAALEMKEVEAAAKALNIDFLAMEVRRPEDIVPMLDGIKGSVQGQYVIIDPLTSTHRVRINTTALGMRLPTMHGFREYVAAGGLMSYGPNFPDLYRRSAELIDKILRGAKAADLPVEQPTKFDLIVNLTTARALGITVPPTLLARADEVIE